MLAYRSELLSTRNKTHNNTMNTAAAVKHAYTSVDVSIGCRSNRCADCRSPMSTLIIMRLTFSAALSVAVQYIAGTGHDR